MIREVYVLAWLALLVLAVVLLTIGLEVVLDALQVKAPEWFQKHVVRRSDIYFNGSLYMRRWLVGPMRGPGIRLHHIVRSDADRELHDHPFSFASIILRGGYFEHTADGRCKWYGPGSIVVRSAEVFHRLRLKLASFDDIPFVKISPRASKDDVEVAKQVLEAREQSAWTLVIRGPYRRQWGFLTDDGWTPWQAFVAERLKDVPTPREPRPYEAPSSL